MDDEPDPPTSPTEPDGLAPTGCPQSRRWLPVAVVNAAALLSTTALMVALEPKMPPYKGD